MNIKKVLHILGLSFILVLSGCSQGIVSGRNDIQGDQLTIGFIQYGEEQDGVDIKRGFVSYLREKGLHDNKIVMDNKVVKEMGAIENVVTDRFINNGVDLIVALNVDEGAYVFEATQDGELPVVYISDQDLNIKNKNVTGVKSQISVEKQFKLMKSLLPQSKTLGIFTDQAEDQRYEELKNIAFKNGLMIEFMMLPTEEKLVELNVEGIFILEDTTNSEEIIKLANLLKLPLFSNDVKVQKDCLAMEVINDYECGRQAGKMAYEILANGRLLQELPVEMLEFTNVVVNSQKAEELGIKIPLELAKRIQTNS